MTLRRIFTLLLALLMLASPMMEALPAIAYAEETVTEAAEETTEATEPEETTEATTDATEPEETTEAITEATTEATTEAEETTEATTEVTTEATEPEETTEAATEATEPEETTEATTEATEPEETTEATTEPEETTEATEETTEATEAPTDDDTITSTDNIRVTGLNIALDSGMVTLNWDYCPGASGYEIYEMAPNATGFTRIVTLEGADSTCYTFGIGGSIDGADITSGVYQYTVAPYIGPIWNPDILPACSPVSAIYVATPEMHCYSADKGMIYGYNVAPMGSKGGIQVYRSTNGVTWTRIKTQTIAKNTAVFNSIVDAKANVGGTHYQYRARTYITINGKNYYSDYNYASNVYLKVPVISSIKKTDEGMAVSWKHVKGAERYQIFAYSYCNDVSSDYTAEYVVTDATIKTITFTDVAASVPGYYSYFVIPLKDHPFYGYETSGSSSVAKAGYILEEPTIEYYANTSKGIEISWSWVQNADNFEVWRSVNNGTFKRIKTVKQDTYYHDTTATKAGATYSYKLRAKAKVNNFTFTSEFGNAVSIVKLAAPIIKSVKKPTSGGYSITFGRVSAADYYTVNYWTNGVLTKTEQITQTAKSKTYTIKDPDATALDQVYEYDITAVDESTNGRATVFASAYNYGDVPFTLENSTAGIRIQANAYAASHFTIYRSVNGGAFKQLKKVAVNNYSEVLDWVDKNVTQGKTYSYKITPSSVYLDGYRTQKSSAQSIVRIGGPTLNTPLNETDGIRLTWAPNAASPAVSKYEVWRVQEDWGVFIGDFEKIATLNGSELTYLDTTATQDLGLAYMIKAILADDSEVFSSTRTTYRMYTPFSLNCENISTTKSMVSWSCDGYAEGCQVRLINTSTNKSRIVTFSNEWGCVEISKLTQNTTYSVSVRHFMNQNGSRIYSAWSDPVTLIR